MSVTAAQVKELRQRTGAGMMECKKALVTTGGDIEAAVDHMRKTGAAKADKKAGRTAAEGRIEIALSGDRRSAVLAEINCETDFVAGGDEFAAFASEVAAAALEHAPADVDALGALTGSDGTSFDARRREMVARIGENMAVRRFERIESPTVLGTYLHTTNKIAAAVALEGGDEELARDLAMHVSWSRPEYVTAADVPESILDKEREIIREQSLASGKPPEIVEKMVEGRLRKYLAEITLVGQPFVKDDSISVGKLLDKGGAKVVQIARLEVGEGIEKKSADFAAEVMAQVRASED